MFSLNIKHSGTRYIAVLHKWSGHEVGFKNDANEYSRENEIIVHNVTCSKNDLINCLSRFLSKKYIKNGIITPIYKSTLWYGEKSFTSSTTLPNPKRFWGIDVGIADSTTGTKSIANLIQSFLVVLNNPFVIKRYTLIERAIAISIEKNISLRLKPLNAWCPSVNKNTGIRNPKISKYIGKAQNFIKCKSQERLKNGYKIIDTRPAYENHNNKAPTTVRNGLSKGVPVVT